MKSCTLAEPRNYHLEESPVFVTVKESLDKEVGSLPRGVSLYQQIAACLISASASPLPPAMPTLLCLTRVV